MRILILGAGKMGSFFTDLLSFEHEVAVYEVVAHKLRFMYNTQRFTKLDEIKEIDFNKIPLEDEKTIELFKEVNTDGIFQFESPGMIKFLKKLY